MGLIPLPLNLKTFEMFKTWACLEEEMASAWFLRVRFRLWGVRRLKFRAQEVRRFGADPLLGPTSDKAFPLCLHGQVQL